MMFGSLIGGFSVIEVFCELGCSHYPSRGLRVFRVIRGSYFQNLNKTIHESHEDREVVLTASKFEHDLADTINR